MALIKVCPVCGQSFVIQAGESKARKYDKISCRRKANQSKQKKGSGVKRPIDFLPRLFLKGICDLPDGEHDRLLSFLTQYETFRRDDLRNLTLAGLSVAKAYGMKPGRPRRMSQETISLIRELRHEKKWTLQAIADELNSRDIPTPQQGKEWYHTTVLNVVYDDKPKWWATGVKRALEYSEQP